ncbi:putative uncharacterized oxidoreductase [Colletotrichum orbiculare MAFF 240422]|uniref:Uncharacterized oxidoreductase n=1 Tax=Colletotrichum orbiculare (strain 104-T / ATCC 96160 / CBS 514.97 / LARS 414 / MAFF 240422) TaxID=1213857 RepID=N4V691_COLOR|nr:putative uncharacterized oxidoreductase [Colletotrichum orbiculare MAFF 240422]
MSGSLVFVTGATGFIGSQVVDFTLKAGYRVRLSVRRQEQIQTLKDTFSAYPDKLEFIIVTDFTKPGAFDEAVAGVDYVVHVASPMVGKGVDFQRDYIDPAVEGTLSVLEAAKTTPSVKRVLIMSSILALVPLETLAGGAGEPFVVKEHANTKLPVDVNMGLPEGIPGHSIRYQGSKILAHQATATWVAKHQPAFPVVTFHPSFVTGPSLLQKRKQDIDSINYLVLETLRSGEVTVPAVMVDVRDVADAFVKGLSAPVPAFQEVLLSGPATTWGEVAQVAQRLYPDAGFKLQPSGGDTPSMVAVTTAADEVLGVKWKSLEELVRGLVDFQNSLAA